MAGDNKMDMKAANATYSGFLGWVKWGSILVALVTIGVVKIISA